MTRAEIATNIDRARIERNLTYTGLAAQMRVRGFDNWTDYIASRSCRGVRPVTLDEGFVLAEVLSIEVRDLAPGRSAPIATQVGTEAALDSIEAMVDALRQAANTESIKKEIMP